MADHASRPTIKRFPVIALEPPTRRILKRMGYNVHRTEMTDRHRKALEPALSQGAALVEPRGAWARISISKRDEETITLATGHRISSYALAGFLKRSHAVLLMAATVGAPIVEAARAAIAKGDGVTALALDAVGGETADVAIDWLAEYVRRWLPRNGESLTEHRYSPGYGDLHLDTQRTIFEIMELERLGLALTERCMLLPEKSVCAIAGIQSTAIPAGIAADQAVESRG